MMCFLVIALIGLVVGVLVSIVPVIFEACGGLEGPYIVVLDSLHLVVIEVRILGIAGI